MWIAGTFLGCMTQSYIIQHTRFTFAYVLNSRILFQLTIFDGGTYDSMNEHPHMQDSCDSKIREILSTKFKINFLPASRVDETDCFAL